MLEDGQLVTLPINNETRKIVGEEKLVETFIRPYSEKMWGMKLEDLDPQIINRIPSRKDDNELYFPDDEYQVMPKYGYTKLFENILEHDNISVMLNTEFCKEMEVEYDFIFNSMPIDEYFDFCHGELPYRSIKFTNINLPLPRLFPVSQVNFTHTGPNSRVVEWKNIPNHGINDRLTTITYEEPCDYKDNQMERYYPVKDIHGQNKNLYTKYLGMVKPNMQFIGRLGLYAYLDMHQCINNALISAKNFKGYNGK
jgi:UDP-galactopyranose mutase